MLYSFPQRRAPRLTLFPYTTLFRSQLSRDREIAQPIQHVEQVAAGAGSDVQHVGRPARGLGLPDRLLRSEEHTSELQSPYELVCRLLLEKKNTRPTSESASLHGVKV